MTKILQILVLGATAIFFSACGGSDQDNNEGSSGQDTPVTPESGPAPADDSLIGLDALIGTVTFNFGFEGSVDRFERSVTFTEDNRITFSGVPLLAEGSWACESISPLFACAYADVPLGVADYFLFDLDTKGNSENGRFERCTTPTDPDRCLSELLINWDGDLRVSVARTTSEAPASAPYRQLPNGGFVFNADINSGAEHYMVVHKQASPDASALGIAPRTMEQTTVPGSAAARRAGR